MTSRSSVAVLFCLLCCAGSRAHGALILDIALDGLVLNGGVTTDLLGSSETIRWTEPQSDDCFLTVDADSLLTLGVILQDETGSALSGAIIIRGGLRIADATGTTVCADSWTFLQYFDTNRDNLIGPVDPLFSRLGLFMDANADGAMVAEELHRPELSLRSVQTGGGTPFVDSSGNTRSDALFTDVVGASGVMTDVDFAALATAAPVARGRLQLDAAPNPFNPSTTLSFEIATAVELRVTVYDVKGREIITLAQGYYSAARHQLSWSGLDATGGAVASGVYIVRLETPDEMTQMKLTLVK